MIGEESPAPSKPKRLEGIGPQNTLFLLRFPGANTSIVTYLRRATQSLGSYRPVVTLTHQAAFRSLNQAFLAPALIFVILTSAGCQPQVKNPGSGAPLNSGLPALPSTTAPATSTSSSGPNAVQIIFATGANGSFDASSVASTGGTYNYAQRFFDLKGNLLSNSNSWWFKASSGTAVFLTSTSTSYPGGGVGATTSSSSSRYRTPCAYFDSTDDNNPETAGYYTIDGLVTNAPSFSDSTAVADIDQCAGISNTEKSKLGIVFTLDRNYLSSTDKIQLIIKAKPLTTPNTAPVPSSCVIGGLFDATGCATNVFNVTLRTALGAAARPFFMLFPSAKALDLISESILLPTNFDSSITTITIDRLKGGAVFYSATLIRVP